MTLMPSCSPLVHRGAARILPEPEDADRGDARRVPETCVPHRTQHGQPARPLLPAAADPGLERSVHWGLHLPGCPMGRLCQAPAYPGIWWVTPCVQPPLRFLSLLQKWKGGGGKGHSGERGEGPSSCLASLQPRKPQSLVLMLTAQKMYESQVQNHMRLKIMCLKVLTSGPLHHP